jgi:hypothetical protein
MGLIADLDCPHVIPAGVRGCTSMERGSATRSHAGTEARSHENQIGFERVAAAGHRPALRTSPKTITRDTPLVPRAAAEGVWAEACALLDEELPREWIGLLIEKAETIYTHGSRFRRRLQSNGNTSRDWLWAFMRHWLAALMQEQRPQLFRKLPSRYCVGDARETEGERVTH